jgi:hypothetical protein
MNKTLTLLTLAALSPLAVAGSKPAVHNKPGFVPSHKFPTVPPTHNFTGGKPTTFSTTTTFSKTTTTIKPPFKPTFPTHPPTFPTTGTGFKKAKPITPIVTPFKGATPNYFATNGVKFSGGVFYKGQSHRQWTKRFFSPRWKTWCFFCPFAKSWFYFNGPRGGFFPTSFIASSPPVASLPGSAFLPAGGAELPIVEAGEEPELPEGE